MRPKTGKAGRIFSLLIFFNLFLLAASPALATCSWETINVSSTNAGPGMTSVTATTGGCGAKGLEQYDDKDCTGTKPTYSTNSGNSAVCCCDSPTAAAEEKAPKFTAPDLQIKIPGMEKFSDITNCQPDGDGSYQCEIPWLGQYITGIYNYALSIAGILAALMLMAGGVIWLVSGGDASRITQAKEIIIGSITGLLILSTSYIILAQINPGLVGFDSITLGTIKKQELKLATSRYGSTAEGYKNSACATDEELAAGVTFYATGYYKPAWEDSDTFRCVIAMQCSCPKGRDMTKNCDFLYGKTFPGYHPCNKFDKDTPYCNMTSSGTAPKDGDIAGPNNCSNLKAGDKVCFRGQTYTITDTGGGIKGKRIDVWSGNNLKKAYTVTGTGTLTKGACK